MGYERMQKENNQRQGMSEVMLRTWQRKQKEATIWR